MAKAKSLPSLEYLKECLEIDLTCPSGLRWKFRPQSHFKTEGAWKGFTTIFAGNPAGTINHQAYAIVLTINKIVYKAHRIVYALFNNTIDLEENLVIDHINRDPFDNRPENLRLVTQSQNTRNKQCRSNISGFPHVYFTYNKWNVRLRLNNELKYFGGFSDLEDAKKVAREISIKYHGEFSPFLNGAFQE